MYPIFILEFDIHTLYNVIDRIIINGLIIHKEIKDIQKVPKTYDVLVYKS